MMILYFRCSWKRSHHPHSSSSNSSSLAHCTLQREVKFEEKIRSLSCNRGVYFDSFSKCSLHVSRYECSKCSRMSLSLAYKEQKTANNRDMWRSVCSHCQRSHSRRSSICRRGAPIRETEKISMQCQEIATMRLVHTCLMCVKYDKIIDWTDVFRYPWCLFGLTLKNSTAAHLPTMNYQLTTYIAKRERRKRENSQRQKKIL